MCVHIHIYEGYRVKRCIKIDALYQVQPVNLRDCINHSEFTKKRRRRRRKKKEKRDWIFLV
jgi:hypothetical protein